MATDANGWVLLRARRTEDCCVCQRPVKAGQSVRWKPQHGVRHVQCRLLGERAPSGPLSTAEQDAATLARLNA